MNLTLTVNDQRFRVNLSSPVSIAIPLQFNGEQPNHFGADKAKATALVDGDFIGDTKQGGSCNVKTMTLVPHCNGTHTESVSHIVNDEIDIGNLNSALYPATIISVEPVNAESCDDIYRPNKNASDKVITRAMLESHLDTINNHWLDALIIRTQPNYKEKLQQTYDSHAEPAYFTCDAIEYLIEKRVQHLLVDIPSIDKMYDEGLLTNHHIFWNVPEGTHHTTDETQTEKTITEMIYVPNHLIDGHYLLNLQIPAFQSDAAPSRPIVYSLETIK